VKGSTWSLSSAVSRVEINWEPICQDLYGVLESRKYAAHACGTGHNRVSRKVFISVIAIGFMKLPAPAEVTGTCRGEICNYFSFRRCCYISELKSL
jgi:hypothetical protein